MKKKSFKKIVAVMMKNMDLLKLIAFQLMSQPNKKYLMQNKNKTMVEIKAYKSQTFTKTKKP